MLSLILLGEFISMTDDHPPHAFFQAVGLGTTKDSVIRVSTPRALHMLKVHRTCKVLADDGQ